MTNSYNTEARVSINRYPRDKAYYPRMRKNLQLGKNDDKNKINQTFKYVDSETVVNITAILYKPRRLFVGRNKGAGIEGSTVNTDCREPWD